jgi:hypothetical protein
MTTKIKSGVIAAGAIDATALADNSITIGHLDCSDGTNGQVLTTDGSGTLSFSTISGYTDSDVETYLNTSMIYTDATNDRLGIGTSSPAEPLHVQEGSSGITSRAGTIALIEGSGNTKVSIASGTTSTGQLLFGSSADNDAGRIIYDHSDDGLQIWTNSSRAVDIDSSGNVGIGASSPDMKLEVAGASGVAGTLKLSGRPDWTSGSGQFHIGSIYGENLGAGVNSTRIKLDGDDTSGAMRFYTANSGTLTSALYIDSNQKIFMNEGAPFAWTDGSLNVSAEIYGDSSDNLVFRNTSAKTERMRINSSGGLSIDTTNVPANTSGALVLANGGAGGPSTTQPGGALWIENAAGTPKLTLYRASGDALRLDAQGENELIFDNSGNYGFLFYNSGTALLFINESADGKIKAYLPIEAQAANDTFKSGTFFNVGENPINNPWHTCTQVNSSGASGGTADCGDCVDTTGTIAGCSQGTGSAYNWYSAKRYCELAGMRLCTAAEVRAGAGAGSGCSHNNRGQWTSTKGTTDSTKYFIVQGDGTGSSATAEQENYPYDTTITGFTTNEIGIRCCQQNSWS